MSGNAADDISIFKGQGFVNELQVVSIVWLKIILKEIYALDNCNGILKSREVKHRWKFRKKRKEDNFTCFLNISEENTIRPFCWWYFENRRKTKFKFINGSLFLNDSDRKRRLFETWVHRRRVKVLNLPEMVLIRLDGKLPMIEDVLLKKSAHKLKLGLYWERDLGKLINAIRNEKKSLKKMDDETVMFGKETKLVLDSTSREVFNNLLRSLEIEVFELLAGEGRSFVRHCILVVKNGLVLIDLCWSTSPSTHVDVFSNNGGIVKEILRSNVESDFIKSSSD